MPTCDDTKVPNNVNGQFELFCSEEDIELANLADQSWLSSIMLLFPEDLVRYIVHQIRFQNQFVDKKSSHF